MQMEDLLSDLRTMKTAMDVEHARTFSCFSDDTGNASTKPRPGRRDPDKQEKSNTRWSLPCGRLNP